MNFPRSFNQPGKIFAGIAILLATAVVSCNNDADNKGDKTDSTNMMTTPPMPDSNMKKMDTPMPNKLDTTDGKTELNPNPKTAQ